MLPPEASARARRTPSPQVHRARSLLQSGRTNERAGRIVEAVQDYEAAIFEANANGEPVVRAEALRRLAVLRHHRSESAVARELCRESYEVAMASGDDVLAAEALNTLAGFHIENGEIEMARGAFHQALVQGGASADLRGRIEQNLGIISNMQGDLPAALRHYGSSLEAFQSADDQRGCAIAYHNLGMISADQRLWDDADRYYRRSREIAETVGDVHLHALCLLNQSEVHLARQCYEEARIGVEEALRIFDRLGTQLDKADAYKILGMVYRETGKPALAESRLRAAIDLAIGTNTVLSEAEASRELALLYQEMGRNQDALGLLNAAYRLFGRIDARVELVDVASKVAGLESTYFKVVRDWGQSIESADSYTFGHCERVASLGEGVGRALGLDDHELTTMRLGAYLHDLGKVRVPHEILNKAGPLTPEEFEVIKMHPVWGLELLASVEFPWDIKPIIRWHHEKYDGSGYPDRLRADEIPLSAQIICIVDVYDALTTTRSYRPAMTSAEALSKMHECRRWWRPDVFEAFVRSVGSEPAPA